MLYFQSKLITVRLLSQFAVVVLMLSVPVFVFISQQMTDTREFASTQQVQANVCGSVCSPTTSCGSPVTVKGKIIDQNGNGVSGVPVVIYTHNRGSDTTPGATTKVTTDTNGDYVSNGFLCGGLSVNTGDNYAVRPQWGQCQNGTCSGANPISYESNQIKKPGVQDCSASSCDFSVHFIPNGSSSSSSSSQSSSSSSDTSFSGSSGSTGSTDSSGGGGSNPFTFTVLSNCQGNATKCVSIQANASNQAPLSWATTTDGSIVTCFNQNESGCTAIYTDGQENPNASGFIQPGKSVEVGFHLSCPANSTDIARASFTLDLQGTTSPFPAKVFVMHCDNTIDTVQFSSHKTSFAVNGYSKNPVSTTKGFTLLLTPVSNTSANPIVISGTGHYDPNSGNFISVIPMDAVPRGKYNIRLHVDGSLDAELVQPNSDSTFTVPAVLGTSKPVTAIPGDVAPGTQGDNFIDIIDYNKMIGCLGKKPVGICQFSDLNGDGVIDENDIELLMQNFGDLGFSFAAPQFSCSLDPSCNSGQNTMQLCSLICTKTN